MILNECVCCDQMFKNTKKNQGAVCPDCKEQIEKEHKAKAESDFWDYMENKFKEVPECPSTR